MKIKVLIFTCILILSLLGACGDNAQNNTDSNASTTETINTEDAAASGNFSEPIYIKNPGTETVIVEMP